MDRVGLRRNAVEPDGAMLTYPRPKTTIERVIPLWPETVANLQAGAAAMLEPGEPQSAELFYLNSQARVTWQGDSITSRICKRCALRSATLSGFAVVAQ